MYIFTSLIIKLLIITAVGYLFAATLFIFTTSQKIMSGTTLLNAMCVRFTLTKAGFSTFLHVLGADELRKRREGMFLASSVTPSKPVSELSLHQLYGAA